MRIRSVAYLAVLAVLAFALLRSRPRDPVAELRAHLEAQVHADLERHEIGRAERALAAAPFGAPDELRLDVELARLGELRRIFETSVLQGGSVPTPFELAP